MSDVLAELNDVLRARKNADPETSYVARLYQKGLDTILKKIGEEATETVVAAKGGDARQVVRETADLWFHSMVLLSHLDIPVAEVLAELGRRAGKSGLEEKAGRDPRG
ncbi:MAG: Phosphoribosyl-ATP pyrophosphatase [Gammaproteobacteria bacterium]|nr:Phosphoribosyl-ATP pyrophosphatase [Gammaproteobacteria bacterium]